MELPINCHLLCNTIFTHASTLSIHIGCIRKNSQDGRYVKSYVTYNATNYLINDETQDRKKERKKANRVSCIIVSMIIQKYYKISF